MRNTHFRIITTLSFIILGIGLFIAGCAASKPNPVAGKSGALLWGENCVRCHNAPSPAAFSDTQWETIGKHMRVRANLTAEEVNKIVEFLSMAN